MNNRAAPARPNRRRKQIDLTGQSRLSRAADGGVDVLWNSPTVAAFSLHAHQTGTGVLVGTSDKGRIYNITNDGRESLAVQTDASQVSTLFSHGSGIYATSSNQGRLFRIGPETVAQGIYESSVLDAKTVAAWGRIWWRAAGNVELQTRSATPKTDETWSPE